MNIKQETISPKRAAEMLGNARSNRNVRPRKVAYYKGVIERGEWEPDNPAPIGIDAKGRLAEGQHRLMGVIEAGKPIKAWVAYDMPDRVIDVLDTGTSRTMADVLRLRGEANAVILAGTLRQVWQYRTYQILGGKGGPRGSMADPSHNELLKLLDAEPNIRGSINATYDKFKRIQGVGPSIFAAAFHLMADVDEDDAMEFFDKVLNGEDLKAGDPIFALRRTLYDFRYTRPKRVSAALLVKAWNAWRSGDEVENLSYRAGGRSPEAFPVIE